MAAINYSPFNKINQHLAYSVNSRMPIRVEQDCFRKKILFFAKGKDLYDIHGKIHKIKPKKETIHLYDYLLKKIEKYSRSIFFKENFPLSEVVEIDTFEQNIKKYDRNRKTRKTPIYKLQKQNSKEFHKKKLETIFYYIQQLRLHYGFREDSHKDFIKCVVQDLGNYLAISNSLFEPKKEEFILKLQNTHELFMKFFNKSETSFLGILIDDEFKSDVFNLVTSFSLESQAIDMPRAVALRTRTEAERKKMNKSLKLEMLANKDHLLDENGFFKIEFLHEVYYYALYNGYKKTLNFLKNNDLGIVFDYLNHPPVYNVFMQYYKNRESKKLDYSILRRIQNEAEKLSEECPIAKPVSSILKLFLLNIQNDSQLDYNSVVRLLEILNPESPFEFRKCQYLRKWLAPFLSILFKRVDQPEQITHLSLKDYGLEFLPQNLERLTYLRSLNLDNNNFTRFPSLKDFELLETLSIKFCNITQISEKNIALARLKELDLSANNLSGFPFIDVNAPLTHINLSANNFEEIPGSLLCLKHLQSLNMSANKIAGLPAHWHKLTDSLEALYLNRNYLQNLEGISQLRKLSRLESMGNYIENFPNEITNMPLRYFAIRNNKLKKLPTPEGLLYGNIQDFDCRNNHINTISSQWDELTANVLKLAGNPVGPGKKHLILTEAQAITCYDYTNLNEQRYVHGLLLQNESVKSRKQVFEKYLIPSGKQPEDNSIRENLLSALHNINNEIIKKSNLDSGILPETKITGAIYLQILDKSYFASFGNFTILNIHRNSLIKAINNANRPGSEHLDARTSTTSPQLLSEARYKLDQLKERNGSLIIEDGCKLLCDGVPAYSAMGSSTIPLELTEIEAFDSYEYPYSLMLQSEIFAHMQALELEYFVVKTIWESGRTAEERIRKIYNTVRSINEKLSLYVYENQMKSDVLCEDIAPLSYFDRKSLLEERPVVSVRKKSSYPIYFLGNFQCFSLKNEEFALEYLRKKLGKKIKEMI